MELVHIGLFRMNRLKTFSVSKKKAIEKIELATSSANDDWIVKMEICNEAKKCPQYYCGIIVAKLCDQDKDVALSALKLLELCVRNCGIRFREFMAKPAVIQNLYHIMKGSSPKEVKQALYQSIKEWSYTKFANEPKLILIPILHYKLYPLWEGETSDCAAAAGKPMFNNLCLEQILKSQQKTLIFKIFEDVDKYTTTVSKTSQFSQSAGSSTNPTYRPSGSTVYINELKFKLQKRKSDTDSSDEEYTDIFEKAIKESVGQFPHSNNQATASKSKWYSSESQLNLGYREIKPISLLDDTSDDSFDEEDMIEIPLQKSPQDSISFGNNSSSSSPKRYLEKLQSKLECKICFELMSTPIFICETGHSVCGECNQRLKKCPLCKALIRTRNFVLEELARTVNEMSPTP